MRRRLALAAISLLASTALAHQRAVEVPASLPAVVDAIEVEGLWRTEPFVVTRELPWKQGDLVTPEAWELGVLRLWNTLLFSRVAMSLEEREGRRIARVRVEERWTIIPIFRGAAGGGLTWIRTGLYDINFLGRFVEPGFMWERYGEYDGGAAWLRVPRLFDERRELLVTVDRSVRPRPAFILRRTDAWAELTQQIHDELYAGARLMVMDDDFLAPPGPRAFAPPNPAKTLALGPTVRFGRVDTVRLRQAGWSLDLRPQLGFTTAPGHALFGQISAELLLFRVAGDGFNFGLRVRGAVSTAVQEHQQFFAGGLDLVRGYTDSYLHGLALGLVNVEVRQVLFDSTWVALMGVAFVDAAAVRPGHRDDSALAASLGLGLRILFPRILRSGIRLDAALPLTPGGNRPFAIGVFQFF